MKPKLPDRYQKWLDEEVVYIITATEREVFQKLTTDRERDLFIEAFWNHRDPTPSTPANEFKIEHYRRIDYANKYLGRETPIPGWKTDRGRMYIILGEPQEIQRYTAKSGIYDCETWFYQDKADKGLPAGFYLLFFKPRGNGMFRLYSPAGDGPQALLTGYLNDPTDYRKAYETLRDVDGGLAEVAMNLVPGEGQSIYGRPSMSSDLLLQKIETLPSRTVEEKYARKFLEYKDIVEVEYSANYLDSDSLIKVFREPNGIYFVHFAVEPQRLSVNQYENKIYTTLRVSGRVTTLDGRPVYQYDKSTPVEVTESQMQDLSRTPFEYHDLFPLIPGDYKVSILVKNEASKEFMSLEQAVRIPDNGPALQLTQPLLGFKSTRVDPAQKKLRAFRLGPYQISCQPSRVFTASDTLAVAFQVNNLPAAAAQDARIKIAFLKDAQPFREIVRKPSDYPDLPDVLEEVSLAGFPPAHYQVRVSVLEAGKEAVSAGEEFDLTFAPSVGRPWYSARVLPEPGDPVYLQIIGTQLFNLGRLDEAAAELELAHQRKPGSPEMAYSLAQAYMAMGRFPRVIELMAPFVGGSETARYEIYTMAGEAYRRSGDFVDAVATFDKAISHYGVNASILNAVGECYAGLGKNGEALAAFEKSLQISPNQPGIQKKIDELKKRK